MTNGCDLKCGYCYLQYSQHPDQQTEMARETAFRSVDFLLDELKKSSSHKTGVITFLGGEPLLNWEVVRAATDYAVRKSRKAKKKVAFTISTNGVLLDKAKIAFIRKHKFSVLLSIDSHKREIHDQLRPTKAGRGSYSKILEKLNAPQAKNCFSIAATLTRKNLQIFAFIKYFSKFSSVRSINFGHIVSKNNKDMLKQKDIKLYKAQMNKYANWVIENWEKGNIIQPQNGYADLIGSLDNKKKMKKAAYCAAGREAVSVSPNGDIYACATVSDVPKFYLGDVFNGIDASLRRNLLNEVESAKSNRECSQCAHNNICGGCFAASYILEGKIKKANETCEFIKIDFEIAQRLLDKLNELLAELDKKAAV